MYHFNKLTPTLQENVRSIINSYITHGKIEVSDKDAHTEKMAMCLLQVNTSEELKDEAFLTVGYLHNDKPYYFYMANSRHAKN